MKLKRFSDFSTIDETVEVDDVILEEKEDDKEIDLEEKTGDEPEDTEEEKKDDKKPTSKNAQTEEEKEKEEQIDENFEIEIIEDNIIKFNNGNIKKIYELLLTEKYSGMDYFIRKKDNNLHVVKYNENLNLNVNNFVDSLFKFYSTKKELKPLVHNIKIKGNDKFSVVENVDPNAIDIIVNDISRLLSKKK